MSHYLRNQAVRSIREGNAVFVVGAGVSLLASGSAPTASWLGLIEAGMQRCEDLDPSLKKWRLDSLRILKGKDASSKVSVAQDVKDHLSRAPGQQYANWLADTVGALPIVNRGILDVLSVARTPILTTNYDDLLERTSGRNAVTWDRLAEMQDEIRNPGSSVIHLHGFWRRQESVVFGYRDYSTVLSDQASQAILRALLAFKTLIFVGFGEGLADPNFSALTGWLTSTLSDTGVAPIALVKDDEYKKGAIARYRPVGINAVPYGPMYDDLESFLSGMKNESQGPLTEDPGVAFGWEYLGPTLKRFHRRIEREFSPDFILSISGPGNYAPAYCLAHSSEGVPVLPAVTFPREMNDSGRRDWFQDVADRDGWIHCQSDEWEIFLPNLLRDFPTGAHALIFDEEVTGGDAQLVLTDVLAGFGYDVKKAALIVAPECESYIDFYEQVVTGKFVFPW
ncbi:SIR2 family NAD-dependent protein deacylase [Streptomyces hokutonensis]|uniref:SIR2 family NAD-dependent protein deacylase n=1 Tax=Streptomyces hokutonensis TaxID=1306990 RepID=UPI00380FFDFD